MFDLTNGKIRNIFVLLKQRLRAGAHKNRDHM